MTRTIAAALFFAAASLPAAAQDDPEGLREAARSYIQSPAQQAVIDRLLSADGIVAQTRQARPDLPEEVVSQLGQIASEELSAIRDDLESAMVEAAAETFTLAEIQALDAFYRTEEGSSVLLKTQTFMQAAMEDVAPDLQAAQQQIMQRAQETLQQQAQ